MNFIPTSNKSSEKLDRRGADRKNKVDNSKLWI